MLKITANRVLALVSAVIIGLVVAAAMPLMVRVWNMKAEYMTARVISNVEEYVVKSHGRWPRSWADLGEDYSRYTNLNFLIDPDTASEAEVANAISPVSGRYLTYPHAASDLKRLYSRLRCSREGQPEPGVGADSR